MMQNNLMKETSQRIESALQIISRYPDSDFILPNTIRFLKLILNRDESLLFPGNWPTLIKNVKARVYFAEKYPLFSSLAPPTPSFECNKPSVVDKSIDNSTTDFAEKVSRQLDNQCLSNLLEQEERKFYSVSDIAESSIDFIYERKDRNYEDSEMVEEDIRDEADVRSESQIELERTATIYMDMLRQGFIN
jgi:hypothetical protein